MERRGEGEKVKKRDRVEDRWRRGEGEEERWSGGQMEEGRRGEGKKRDRVEDRWRGRVSRGRRERMALP